ncbi:hypothetical protein Ancab_004972 [Ancistrocladus abbreviatus]
MKAAVTTYKNSHSHSPTKSREMIGLEEMGTQKIAVSEHIDGFKYESVKSDSFILDLESFSNGVDRDFTANSRITLQRNLSRKGCQRGGDKKIIGLSPNDKGPIMPSSSSARAAPIGASSTPEKPASPGPAAVAAAAALWAADHPTNQLPQHQISIKTSSICCSVPDSRWGKRYNLRRSLASWFLDPRRILLFFATVSSLGTLLLIFFTLYMGKPNENESSLAWQQ